MSRIPFVGNETTARDRLDDIFSRKMLGSVFVGGAASKIVETTIQILAPALGARLAGWTLAFVFFVVVFIYWERIEQAASEMTTEVTDE